MIAERHHGKRCLLAFGKCGSARLNKVGAGAGPFDPGCLQIFDRVEKSFVAEVERVIIGKADQIDSCRL
jgi:hypothetical protein